MQLPKKEISFLLNLTFCCQAVRLPLYHGSQQRQRQSNLSQVLQSSFLKKKIFALELEHKKCQLYQIHSTSKGQCSFIDDGDDYSFDDLNDLFLLLMISMVYSVENWANLIDGMRRGEVGKVTTKIDQVRLFGG